jgi:hypothetical protein
MYASAWFMTLYTYSLPLPLVVRIFDSFLWEGWKVIYRVALQLLTTFEAPLLASTGLEEVMAVFKLMPETLVGGPAGAHHLPNAAVRSERAAITRNGGAGVERVLALMPRLDGSHEEIDRFLADAFALPILHRDLALLDREYDALLAAGCATSAESAGAVLRRGGVRGLPQKAQEAYAAATAAAALAAAQGTPAGPGASPAHAAGAAASAAEAPRELARPMSWGKHHHHVSRAGSS